MTLPPTFRRRKRSAVSGGVELFIYDICPEKLRVQIEHVLVCAIGSWDYERYATGPQNEVWTSLRDAMRQEEGVTQLPGTKTQATPDVELLGWMRAVGVVDAYLEALEWLLRAIDNHVRKREPRFSKHTSRSPDDALAEINARMLEAGFGYAFQNGDIIKVDSLLLHRDVVLPAINLTNSSDFASANTEYMRAHEAFRQADYETCLTECAKAFESVLKVIAAKRLWPVASTDPASRLIDAAVEAGFLQSYVQAGFTALRSMLASGAATVRNKSSAHGAGTTRRVIAPELAAFQLHQTAAVIIFLIESHERQA